MELQIQALCLVQALLGVISPNFRMVSISAVDGGFKIRFLLAKECDEDREEIEDAESEFEALQSRRIEYEFEVVVSEDPIDLPDGMSMVVYRRREP